MMTTGENKKTSEALGLLVYGKTGKNKNGA
jgi:hypothetical protein